MSYQCSNNNKRFKLKIFLTLFLLLHNPADATKRYCGSQLTEILAAVCVNGFNDRIKRCLEKELQSSGSSIPAEESLYDRLKDILGKVKADESEQNEENEENPVTVDINLLNSQQENGVKRKRRQVDFVSEPGVADKCCTNGCAYEDMLSYCN